MSGVIPACRSLRRAPVFDSRARETTVTQPVARTRYGLVRGALDGGIAAFRGIPYASAPVGSLRFAPPVAPASWKGELDATSFGPAAPQQRPEGGLFPVPVPVGEDCLTLNVWTPAVASSRLPVLVWVHGGAFLNGTSAAPLQDKGTFARDDVVFVSINYRLGVDGFFFAQDDPNAGNYGLLDQIAALRWVQENISSFGGDPSRVTVGGQSAGATAVAALIAAPPARGLFTRAVVQSGYPDPLLSQSTAAAVAQEMYQRLDLPEGDLEALRELRERSPERVITAQHELFLEVLRERDSERLGHEVAITANPFQPVVGGPVLPQLPAQAIRTGAAPPIDLLIGHTTEEAQLAYGLGMRMRSSEPLTNVFERALPGRGEEALAIYRQAYPDAASAKLQVALDSDQLYRIPLIRLADANAERGGRTFFYRFDWRSQALDGVLGAGHGVDQPFIFDALDLPQGRGMTGEGAPQALADAMHRSWVSFVTTGDPWHEDLPAWQAYDVKDRAALQLGGEPRLIHDPGAAQRELWLEPAAHVN
jgi:para-nitrobenzyl esterase